MSSAFPGQTAFEQDVKAYITALPRLLSNDEGRFALVGAGALTNVYDDREKAMSEGYARFGERGFLVQKIAQYDLVMSAHWHQ